ncbi:hypothetical protein [Oerskovia turbata]
MRTPGDLLDVLVCVGEEQARVALLPPAAASPAATTSTGSVEVGGALFEVVLETTAPSDDGAGVTRRDVRVRVRLVGGPQEVAARVRVVRTLPAADPWWMIPGLFYGENRPVDCERVFPRYAPEADDPAGMTSSAWSFRSDRAATPAVFAWGEGGGVALVVDEVSAAGPTGIGFAHDDGQARVHVDFPYREGPVSYYGDATPRPAQALTHRFVRGQDVELRLAAFHLPPDRHAYAPVLRAVWERTAPAPVGWVDARQAADLTADGLYTWHYDPDPGVLLETVGFDREITVEGRHVDRQAMHVGWVSGLPWSYALLLHGLRTGRAEHVAAACRVTDFVTSALSPSGTFWGAWYRSSGWSQSWTPIRDGLHARTLGEATHFLVRSLVALAEHAALAGHSDHAEHDERRRRAWEGAARSNLDAVAARQREDGNLGAVHHAVTGEVLRWRGAAGLAWIPAFVEATEAGLGDYLAVARRAGEHYAGFVEREFIHGAPEDVDLAPTSEDGYAAVMAYTALHRATGERRWLDLAARAADWMLTFRYTYDVSFPERTLLGRYAFSTRGADQASPSNQHLHNYGLVCTREMLELSEATGDDHYARRALETVECFRQFVAREDGDFNAYRGMVTERYYQTDCFQPKGMILTLSHAWCVGATLLGNEQVLRAGRAA